MIPIKNVYYMLTYAFKVLKGQGYQKLATEEFHHTADLMSAILAKGIAIQLKRGLGKEYLSKMEELSTLRGKIEITESIKSQSTLGKKIFCTYEEFSVNNRMNRIIKSTFNLLLKADISKNRKKELRKLMVYFRDVELVDLKTVNWNLQYNKNNQSYRMMIAICYLVVKGLLQTTSDGNMKMMSFLDERRMNRLYEKFILEYYKKHYPELNANAAQIPWALDDGSGEMLPVMQSDIQLQKESAILIIDAKYYKSTTQMNFRKYSQKNGSKVSGMLLYAKTDEVLQPDNVYQMHGNQISVRTLNLNLPFKEIGDQLDTIVVSHFGNVKKFR